MPVQRESFSTFVLSLKLSPCITKNCFLWLFNLGYLLLSPVFCPMSLLRHKMTADRRTDVIYVQIILVANSVTTATYAHKRWKKFVSRCLLTLLRVGLGPFHATAWEMFYLSIYHKKNTHIQMLLSISLSLSIYLPVHLHSHGRHVCFLPFSCHRC